MLLLKRTIPNFMPIKKIIRCKFRLFVSDRKIINNNIVSSLSSDVVVPDVNIAEWIYEKMEPFHRYTAVECAQTGKKYTYEEVRIKAQNLSKALRKNWNLQKEDAVAVLISNSPDLIVANLGVLEAGLILTTINPTYTADEIKKQLADSPAKLIITQPESFHEVRRAMLKLKLDYPILCVKKEQCDSLPEGAINFEEIINTKLDFTFTHNTNSNDIALLPYSSGTTGLPKGVEITHRNLVAMNAQTIHPDYNFVTPPTDNHQDICAGVIPIFHIYGFTLVQIGSLTTGMKLLTFSKFSPNTFISGLQNHKISILYAAPPLVLFLTHYPGVKKEYLDSFKFILSGGAPLGHLDEEKFLNKIGRPFALYQAYGLTETSGIVTTMSSKKIDRSSSTHLGACGGAVPSTLIKIIDTNDAEGKPLGPNESGEVLLKAPQVMKGYYNKPEQTKEVFLDGWYKSGDIGHYNNDGLLFVTDRMKELIKVKGFQVAPAELEALIRDFPSVQDAAVIGVPHPTFGEVPRAYVVKKNETNLKPEDITKYVENNVSKFKHLLGGVELVDTIPKSISGKILRRELRQAYLQQIKC